MSSIVLPILKAHFRAVRNELRYDRRVRIAWCIGLVFDCAVAYWSIPQLVARVTRWQAQGPLTVDSQLWVLCLFAWSGIGFFTIISTLQYSFGKDEAPLLITLPIAPATRFRAWYGLLLVEGIGNWLLLETIVIGVALAITLRWQVLSWLLLLLFGVGVVALCSIVATLLVTRYILLKGKLVLQIAVVGNLVLALVAVLAYGSGFPSGFSQLLAVFALSRPEVVGALFALLLLGVTGPLAGPIGKLYLAAFYTLEGRSERHTALNVPGVHACSALLGRYRTLTGALLVKGLLNQSRHVFGWIRLMALLVCLALFPLARGLTVAYHIPDMLLVIAYACGVAILPIGEYAPYTVSGEGNRLALYLTAPVDLAAILRAKVATFLCFALCVGLPSSLVLGLMVGLSAVEISFVVAMVALVLVGYTIFVVCGSVWGENLELTVEGWTQTLFQEELPITPQRIWLLNLSVLLLGVMVLLVWRLPAVWALLMMVALDGIVIAVIWRLSLLYLRQVLKGTV